MPPIRTGFQQVSCLSLIYFSGGGNFARRPRRGRRRAKTRRRSRLPGTWPKPCTASLPSTPSLRTYKAKHPPRDVDAGVGAELGSFEDLVIQFLGSGAHLRQFVEARNGLFPVKDDVVGAGG